MSEQPIFETEHKLTIYTIAIQTYRGRCTCGWRSGEAHLGSVHHASQYSIDHIRSDWQAHVDAAKADASVRDKA